MATVNDLLRLATQEELIVIGAVLLQSSVEWLSIGEIYARIEREGNLRISSVGSTGEAVQSGTEAFRTLVDRMDPFVDCINDYFASFRKQKRKKRRSRIF